ncbi:MAG: RagB/SusD family nutrient uptake outer membrane protein [Saprospiraceae bacterium]|nr:RagB/SusD family nutrient uptake outer membrane protein [Saprospiraceae bacterium]
MKNLILVLLLNIGLFTACNDRFLDIKPKENVSIADAIVSVPTMRTALMGTYSLMQHSDYYGRTLVVLPDLMSDNMYQSVVAGSRYNNYDRYSMTEADVDATNTWAQIYRVIINANAIIERGADLQTGFSTDEAIEIKQLRGEAHAIRALAYFDLCKLFAKTYTATTEGTQWGVPIVLSYPKNKTDISYPARNTVKEVYDQIIRDAQFALDLMPPSGTVINGTFTARLNRWGVYALLSRVYLYKGDWGNAEKAATQVISSGKYSLLPNATLVTDYKKQLNTESIFEIVNTEKDNQGTDGVAYLYSQMGYGEMLASTNLYSAYNAADARKGFMSKGNRNASGGETNVNLINKYSGNTEGVHFNENIKVFRLAEMYLIRAEARARLGSDIKGAQADVQLIRSRAYPTAAMVTETGTGLIDFIMNERRREFAFEGYRLFDLLRTKTNFTKYSAAGNTISITWMRDKVTLPIPQREILINPNLVQNAGY